MTSKSGGKMTFPIRSTSMLSDLIDLLREKGVQSIKWGDIELTLGPAPATSAESTQAIDNAPKERKLVKPGVLGKDGLTAEEQLELYNEVRDAIPPTYED